MGSSRLKKKTKFFVFLEYVVFFYKENKLLFLGECAPPRSDGFDFKK